MARITEVQSICGKCYEETGLVIPMFIETKEGLAQHNHELDMPIIHMLIEKCKVIVNIPDNSPTTLQGSPAVQS